MKDNDMYSLSFYTVNIHIINVRTRKLNFEFPNDDQKGSLNH